MLLYFLATLTAWFGGFNVLRYLTFRAGAALVTAFVIGVVAGAPFIAFLRRVQKRGQPIRDDGPQSHLLTKRGTPTMGGIVILGAFTASSLLWADIRTAYVLPALLLTLFFGLIGFADDYMKVKKHNVKGVSGRKRLLIALAAGVLAGFWIWMKAPHAYAGALMLPFVKTPIVLFAPLMIAFASLVIVGSANAVNLTDGLDGLVAVPAAIAASALGLIAYLAGNIQFAEYLHIPYLPDAGELSVACAAMAGAVIAFLWYNAPPAEVFMGDTGALAIGAFFGYTAVVTRHEFVWAIIGSLFVAETVSVMLQVASFRTTGRRVFRMAPLHHHYEQLGWKETKIVIRFWIVAFIAALLGLATLKLR